MRSWSSLGLVLVAAGALVVPACAGGETFIEPLPGQGGSTTTETDCTPGMQQACECEDGSQGIHVCEHDGSGWGLCDCEPVSTDPCGDGVCDDEEDENCHTCGADCGACAACDIAPACGQEMVPPQDPEHFPDLDILPASFAHYPALDGTLRPLTAEQKAARLYQAIESSSAGMRVLAAALDEPQPDEHLLVARLREVFASSPVIAERVRAVLRSHGLASLRDYRRAHPVARDEGEGFVAPSRLPVMAHGAASGASPADSVTPMGDEFPLPMFCGDPFLRIGVTQINVHEDYDDVTNDEVYCVIQAEAQTGGEIRMTPLTPGIDEGESYLMSLESGVFWGQTGPRTPGGPMMITYDCWESDSGDDGYQAILQAIGEAAIGIGGTIPGQAGWIIVAIGVVAEIVAVIWSIDTDDYLLNLQQTVAEEDDYELTNGVYWSVRKADDGGTFGSAFDWELVVKAWGCAEYGEL